ncbi:MAG: hypothetical protein JXA06_09345, partial [Bacteroidetes bacterium]|nr:hypothetical protein [Bacteroidota bacterium]
MKNLTGNLWRLVLITLLGFIGSLISGLMKYGGEIFDPLTVGFAYFILYGICTSFIFAFYHVRGLISTIGVAFLAGAIIFIITPSWMPTINSIVWSFGVSLSVIFIAFLFERKLAGFKRWKFIFVGLFYGAIFVLLTFLMGIFVNVTAIPAETFQKNFVDGLLLGLCVSLGVDLAEVLIHSV